MQRFHRCTPFHIHCFHTSTPLIRNGFASQPFSFKQVLTRLCTDLSFWKIFSSFSTYSQQPCSWVSISGPGPGATFHGRENPEHLAVEPVEPVEPVVLEPLHFLNPRNFWNLWKELNGSKHSLGSNTQWFHRFQTGSLGWTRHWFHRFQTGSLRSTTPLVPQDAHRFLGFNHATGSTGFQTDSSVSLGSTTPLIPQVPDRFLGFNRGTVGIVEGVNCGITVQTTLRLMRHCAAPFLKWAGIRFWQECLSRIETTPPVPQVPDRLLGFNHATGSTASRQVPWVQTRNGSTGSRQVLWVEHATGSTGSWQVPWVQPRYGSNRLKARNLYGTGHATVSQVPDRFLGFNRGTVGIVEGVNHQTMVLFNVPLSINQQWEPWSLGALETLSPTHLVSQ